jgi:ATP-binding cassette subfamily B protein
MTIAHSRAAATRVAEVLDTPGPAGGTGTARLGRGGGRLTFRRVTVRSGPRLVLDGLDLDIPAGVTAAVVGLSGTGKSTLAALAGRLAEPDEGVVLLDGTAVSALLPSELRRGVAYAFARPACLGKTVADDIGYGSRLVARADIERAARLARADDFIRRLPDGYDTPLAMTPLSGGERQRLGIARAIVAGARVLVLDDATSSLDTATEAQVSQAIRDLQGATTTLIVAHRAGTAARADTVVWLDQGRVRGLAPHATLWRDPAYRAVFGGGAPQDTQPRDTAPAGRP